MKEIKKKLVIYLISGIVFLTGIGTVAYFAWPKKEVEKQSVPEKNQQFQNKEVSKILEKIKNYESIICLSHIFADGDSLGFSIGLVRFIKDNFPTKKVFIDGKISGKFHFVEKWLKNEQQLTEEDYKKPLVIICDTPDSKRIGSKYWKI